MSADSAEDRVREIEKRHEDDEGSIRDRYDELVHAFERAHEDREFLLAERERLWWVTARAHRYLTDTDSAAGGRILLAQIEGLEEDSAELSENVAQLVDELLSVASDA